MIVKISRLNYVTLKTSFWVLKGYKDAVRFDRVLLLSVAKLTLFGSYTFVELKLVEFEITGAITRVTVSVAVNKTL